MHILDLNKKDEPSKVSPSEQSDSPVVLASDEFQNNGNVSLDQAHLSSPNDSKNMVNNTFDNGSLTSEQTSVMTSGVEEDIPDLLEPYRLISDEEIAALPTKKEQKAAQERQKRRIRRRSELEKALTKYERKHPQASPEEVFAAVFPKIEKKRTKKKRPIISILVMVFGALLLAFPIVSDMYANYQAQQAITSYTQSIESMSQEEKDLMIAQAIAYNHRLAGELEPYDVDIDDVDYNDIIDATGTGIMGNIVIDCIGVNQPIYHGTDENTLMAGVGHMEGTSFPIPTGATYAAIAGHTGMPGQRMFDELVDLEPGDKLRITILDRTTWYQVTDSEVVDPDQKNTFSPVPGKDLLTLITCTPYGINDHRLLVHCEKIDISKQDQSDRGIITEDKFSKYINLRTIPIIITAALILFGIIWRLLKSLRKSEREKKRKKMEKKRKQELALNEAIARGGARYAAARNTDDETNNQASKSSSGTPE